jgi:hypothetical protein
MANPIKIRAVLQLDKRSLSKTVRAAMVAAQAEASKSGKVREIVMPPRTTPAPSQRETFADGTPLPWDTTPTKPKEPLEKLDKEYPRGAFVKKQTGVDLAKAERLSISEQDWNWARKRLDDFEKDLGKWYDRIDQVGGPKKHKRMTRHVTGAADDVEKMRTRFQEVNLEELDTGKTQLSQRDKLIKQLKTYEKGWAGIQKKVQGVSKAGNFMNSGFAKFSIIMSGIAATLFVWQQIIQLLRSVIVVGTKYLNLLRETAAAYQLNAKQARYFRSEIRGLMKEGVDTKEIGEAYKHLRERGLSANVATEKLALTLKLAKNPMIDLSNASKIVAYNMTGLQNQVLEANKAIGVGGVSAGKRFKGMITDMFATWYEDREPAIIKQLKFFELWVDHNKDAILGMIDDIATGITVIGAGVATLTGFILKLAEALREVSWDATTEVWKLFNRAETKATPVGFSYEEYEKFTDRAKAEGWSAQKKQLEEAKKARKFYIDELFKYEEQIQLRKSAGKETDLKWFAGAPTQSPEQRDLITEKLQMSADKAKEKVYLLLDAIRALQKVVDAESKKKEVDKGAIIDFDTRLKGWETYYKEVGRMSEIHRSDLEKILAETVNKIQPIVGKTAALQIEAELRFKLDKREFGPMLREHKEFFKTIGKIPVRLEGDREVLAWYEKNIQFIKQEIQLMEWLNTAEKQALETRKLRMLWIEKEAPKLKAAEYVFKETGTVTPYLREREEGAAYARASTAMQQGVPPTEAMSIYHLELAQIAEKGYAKQREMHEDFWTRTGIITEDHLNNELKMQRDMRNALMQVYPKMGLEIIKIYDKMAQDTINRLNQPTINSFRSMYDAIGGMSPWNNPSLISRFKRCVSCWVWKTSS